MPSTWSFKEERKYQHIVSSELKRGTPLRRAKEIAARTINKERRRTSKTLNRTSQGTGNPNLPLEKRSVTELRNRAAELEIKGRSDMRKKELIAAIRESG